MGIAMAMITSRTLARRAKELKVDTWTAAVLKNFDFAYADAEAAAKDQKNDDKTAQKPPRMSMHAAAKQKDPNTKDQSKATMAISERPSAHTSPPS